MRRILILMLIAAITCSLILMSCAQPSPAPTPKPAPTPAPASQKVIELKFAHQSAPTGLTAVRFLNLYAKRIEEATNGKVKVTMYPAESLVKAKQEVESTIGGVTDISWATLGYYTGRFPLSSVMSLPFMGLSSGKIDGKVRSGGAVNSHIQQELYETLPEMQAEWKEVKVLYILCSDPYQLFTSKKPVRNMDDIKGLKVRELGGYPSEMWKSFGATPTGHAMPEVYEAVDKGVIDGGDLPWSAISTYKFYEVLKYWTDAPLIGAPMFVIMNLDKWNGFPPDIQKAIMSVSGIQGAEAAGDGAWGSEIKDEVLTQAQKAGRVLERVGLPPGEFDRWKEVAGKPIWDRWVADMKAKGLNGQKVLDATLSLLKKYSP